MYTRLGLYGGPRPPYASFAGKRAVDEYYAAGDNVRRKRKRRNDDEELFATLITFLNSV